MFNAGLRALPEVLFDTQRANNASEAIIGKLKIIPVLQVIGATS